jgi:hypothetical protein
MADKWTRTAAFRFYNAKPSNPNWSWSARSADGRTVVVTLWKHEFKGPAGKMVYAHSGLGNWHEGNGSRTFSKDLVWALANCEGLVRVVVVTRLWSVSSRVRTAECYPQKNLLMRITHLNLKTGAFTLEQVVPAEGAAPVKKVADIVHFDSITGAFMLEQVVIADAA